MSDGSIIIFPSHGADTEALISQLHTIPGVERATYRMHTSTKYDLGKTRKAVEAAMDIWDNKQRSHHTRFKHTHRSTILALYELYISLENGKPINYAELESSLKGVDEQGNTIRWHRFRTNLAYLFPTKHLTDTRTIDNHVEWWERSGIVRREVVTAGKIRARRELSSRIYLLSSCLIDH